MQYIINRESESERTPEQWKEAYQNELIAEYMGNELKQIEKLERLQKEGYNVITNKLGEYKHDYEANQKGIIKLESQNEIEGMQAREKEVVEKHQRQRS